MSLWQDRREIFPEASFLSGVSRRVRHPACSTAQQVCKITEVPKRTKTQRKTGFVFEIRRLDPLDSQRNRSSNNKKRENYGFGQVAFSILSIASLGTRQSLFQMVCAAHQNLLISPRKKQPTACGALVVPGEYVTEAVCSTRK